ncbi:MAG TPA: HAMP domain-containing sensor histidine kinase [Chloroflexia bacterium]|nr:HAMP domain-containing sensor histidine kinase [Chloroflexia bacterium]
MSLRMRFAAYCTGLCVLVLLLVGLLSYSLHVRGHYDDMDRMLVANADHVVSEIDHSSGPLQGMGELDVALRVFDHDGALVESTANAQGVPFLTPHAVLAAPAGPPYDFLAALAPPLVRLDSSRGAFSLVSTPEERWRFYVQPLTRDGNIYGYVEAVAPLGRLDSSMQTFRYLLLGVGIAGIILALFGSLILAGRALRPVGQMVETASTIAASRDFTHRVSSNSRKDELGKLATTFNKMLDSLEEAYRTQQRFISDASHELRAPLTAIQGNLELLRRQSHMPEAERTEALAEAEREASRLTRLVADLLALARADAGISIRHQPVDLDEIILESFQVARKLSQGHNLELDSFEPLKVEGDADRLKQLVLILLDNALKYTPPGGQVRLGLKQAHNQVQITVQDNGVGIGEEDLAHIFERFYRADPARGRDPGGTGLGLSIAKWIVEQHSGQIEVSSNPGLGTTFTVSLPFLPVHPSTKVNSNVISAAE